MIRPPEIQQARPSEYSMIRPFSYAAQSTPETIMSRFAAEQRAMNRDTEEEKKELTRRSKLLDALTKRMDEQLDRSVHKIRDQMIGENPWRLSLPSHPSSHEEDVRSRMSGEYAESAGEEGEEQEEKEPGVAASASSSSGHEVEQEADELRNRERKRLESIIVHRRKLGTPADKMTIKEYYDMLKSSGIDIRGYGRMNKPEFINAVLRQTEDMWMRRQ